MKSNLQVGFCKLDSAFIFISEEDFFKLKDKFDGIIWLLELTVQINFKQHKQ